MTSPIDPRVFLGGKPLESASPNNKTVESSNPSVSSEKKESAAPAFGDSLHLTKDAKALRMLEEKLTKAVIDAPEVDMAKVERIKNQIASGEYKVSAENIANRLLAEATDH